MRYIGDVHEKFDQYLNIVNGCDESIQVGDFGAGFSPLPFSTLSKHRFIRGNHDNPEICRKNPNWIPDGSVIGNTMFIGGALSADAIKRFDGENWWRDEECDMSAMYDFMDIYKNAKPEIMVTHDCPETVSSVLFNKSKKTSRTIQMFDALFRIHSPKIWIFGHHHWRRDSTIGGTRFICLEELGYIDL